jgi:hypothetical protein
LFDGVGEVDGGVAVDVDLVGAKDVAGDDLGGLAPAFGVLQAFEHGLVVVEVAAEELPDEDASLRRVAAAEDAGLQRVESARRPRGGARGGTRRGAR